MTFFLLFPILITIIIILILNQSYATAVHNAQEAIANSLQEGVVGIDNKSTIVLFNKTMESLSGSTTQKALGQNIDTVLKFYQDQSLLTFADYNAVAGSKVLRLHTSLGKEIPCSISVSPFTFGSKQGYILSIQNFSQEKQLEEMKVDFVSMAAHELRTPLTAIRGYASLLQLHYATHLEEQAKTLLTRLVISTTTLANLIDNLLSVSRIERNNMVIEAKPIDIASIVKDIYESFKQQATTRHQKFTLETPQTLPPVMADPFRIGQVFINLISNALTYTPEGGTITITITPKDTNLEISVQDTGEGIPAEAMPRLFTKFFRVSGSLEQGSKGTGLGLYITKSIIEMHNGKIWADSTLGKGSKFTFTLPVATKEEMAKHKESIDNAFLTAKNGQAIIIKKSSENLTDAEAVNSKKG